MPFVNDIKIEVPERSALQAAASEISSKEAKEFDLLLAGAAVAARDLAGHWDFSAPSRLIDEMVCGARALPPSDARSRARLRRAAVARLALGHFNVEDRLPYSIRALYAPFFNRLAAFLRQHARERYDDDFFAKDVRYALGVTIPTDPLQIDLKSHIGPKLILVDLINRASLRSTIAYALATGWGRWYGIHIDLRAMKEFSPEGWTASFARMADILRLNPTVCGVAGVSWFFDPRVEEISPRLGYVRTPIKHGAFLVRIGTGAQHVENALFRSPQRRKLYEEGKYVPTCYVMAWPRRALLSWARSLKVDPSVAFRLSDLDPLPPRTRNAEKSYVGVL